MSNVQFEALDESLFADLLAGNRGRGEYDAALKAFVEQGAKGVEVSLMAGQFAGKKMQSVLTGFKSASKREGAPQVAKDGNVAIIGKNDRVFLVRRDLVQGAVATAPAPEPDAETTEES